MATIARPLNSWDIAKVIGLLLMVIDHTGAYFYLHEEWLRAIGRGSAPIFLFLAGYASSYRFNRELLVLALLMSLSNIIMGEYTSPLNILFTILLCRGVLAWLSKRGKTIVKPLEWFVGCALFALPTGFLFQYGTLGMMLAVGGYMKARPAQYALRTQKLFLGGTFVSYALTYTLLFGLGPSSFILMSCVLLAVFRLLWRLDIYEVNTAGWPTGTASLAKFSSRYSAHIYAFHLIAISWISGYPI